jgi:non-specific serine/threonine protein kinase/serine/threonine-protein kinase
MTPETWQQIKTIFHAALELDPARRAPYLREACAGDPLLRAQVESLVESHEQAGDFIAEPAFVGARLASGAEGGAESLVGRRIGAYEIARELGRGGMGAVYLGVRADAQFDQRVAIKIVKRGTDTDFVLRRFSRERRTLAALDHPNIGKLLDGGATEDGLPYFVMEYIEGLSLNAYCDERRLSITERLKLFREVCSAVSYAHQNLIVHRDLKPSNILVTRDGTPKLLDFGIAKLLDPALAEQTVERTATFMRLMTPEYASPEQVRGLPITTASDVYSLGVLLYELLTGHRPYRLKGRAPEEVERAVCEQEPERPSTAVSRVEESPAGGQTEARSVLSPETVADTRDTEPVRLRRRLAGDLDTIILKALRKEPQRRYASAEQLSEDIRRHLEGLPVTARRDTFAYRTSKFIRRYRAGVAAAALVLLTLLAGAGATAWEAHRARVERARAERRFDDVRRLANSFLFEFHDAIKDLPGSTSARELVVKRALEYLDSLARESTGDASLKDELGVAYRKVGDVQGQYNDASLGDTGAALESYRKAVALHEKLYQSETSNTEYADQLTTDYGRLSQALAATGKTSDALGCANRALEISRAISAARPDDLKLRAGLGRAYYDLGELYADTGDAAHAVEVHRQGLAVRELLPALTPPSDWRTRHSLATSYNAIGRALNTLGDKTNALAYLQKALEIDDELARADPDNAFFWRVLAAHDDHIFETLKDVEPGKALEYKRQGVALSERLLAADPQDAAARYSTALGYKKLGKACLKTGDAGQALGYFNRALALYGKAAAGDPNNVEILYSMAEVHAGIGNANLQRGETARSLESYRAALSILEPLREKAATKLVFNSILADTYRRVGDLYRQLAGRERGRSRWREARSWYERSATVYARMRDSNMLQDKDDVAAAEEANRAIGSCDAALTHAQ